MSDQDETPKQYKNQTHDSSFKIDCPLEVFWQNQLSRVKERAEDQEDTNYQLEWSLMRRRWPRSKGGQLWIFGEGDHERFRHARPESLQRLLTTFSRWERIDNAYDDARVTR